VNAHLRLSPGRGLPAYAGKVLKLLIFVLVIAVAVYFAVRLLQRAGGATPPSPGRSRPRPPARPQGPDDDDAFLRDLDRRRRHRDESES